MGEFDDVMLVTLGLGHNPGDGLAAIAAVRFDRASKLIDEDGAFYAAITPESCVAHGLRIAPESLKWWSQYPELAQATFDGDLAVGLQAAVVGFADWLLSNDSPASPRIWSSTPSGSMAMLRAAFYAAGIAVPWSVLDERCCTTLREEYPTVTPPTLEVINPMTTAVSMARFICACSK